jgi:low affinity Fe/Cu permease
LKSGSKHVVPDFNFYTKHTIGMSVRKSKVKTLSRAFNKFSGKVTHAAGRPVATILAFAIVVVWGVTGPIFDYSTTWQLLINTGTTIITFLMVFIIQQSQNKDTLAIQLKLNELIACHERASNRLIDIEDLTEEELVVLKKFYIKLSDLAESESELYSTHSLDEATQFHNSKHRQPKVPTNKTK